MTEIYALSVHVSVRQTGSGRGEITISSSYEVQAADLLAVLKILAELEAYTRKLAGAARP